MKSIMRGLSILLSAAVLTTAASQGAQAQIYMHRFMRICEHMVITVSPGSPPVAVCACTMRRGFASMAANPQVAAALLQGMQTSGQFALGGVALTTPDQQQAAMSAMATLGGVFASCIMQPY